MFKYIQFLNLYKRNLFIIDDTQDDPLDDYPSNDSNDEETRSPLDWM